MNSSHFQVHLLHYTSVFLNALYLRRIRMYGVWGVGVGNLIV